MSDQEKNPHSKMLFWGCFIALITTGFAFVGRLQLLGVWGAEFGLDKAQQGILGGIGIWPFAVSIILFSLFIDKVGYKVAMLFACGSHIIWAILGVSAYFVSKSGNTDLAYNMLVVGSLIVALGNGAVEAFINPVVATIFSKDKTKWLNILHAAWPGGLVIMGLIVIMLAKDAPWAINVGVIAIPAVIYGLILIREKFPESERVSSGVTYKEMLAEFGAFGAFVAGTLTGLQITIFLKQAGAESITYGNAWVAGIVIGVIAAAAMFAYTKSLGRPLMAVFILIMMPLAITEIGTDGWITAAMEEFAKENKFPPIAVLIYTSLIMLVLRFFAGPIIKVLTPLGLLVISAVLAIAGLTWLSVAEAGVLIVAATLYGLGKTFFWPTMLGIVSEQTPRGGALTLNAISGIGMLACGAIGFPLLGLFQIDTEKSELAASEIVASKLPALIETVDGETTLNAVKATPGLFGEYTTVDQDVIDKAIAALPEADRAAVTEKTSHLVNGAPKKSLAKIAIFPTFMLLAYIGLFLYFKSKGGYKAQSIGGAEGTVGEF
ncbi:MAG: MFS family permease [Pseudoalteromonas tetraodonis]|jgi:MFS family permease